MWFLLLGYSVDNFVSFISSSTILLSTGLGLDLFLSETCDFDFASAISFLNPTFVENSDRADAYAKSEVLS